MSSTSTPWRRNSSDNPAAAAASPRRWRSARAQRSRTEHAPGHLGSARCWGAPNQARVAREMRCAVSLRRGRAGRRSRSGAPRSLRRSPSRLHAARSAAGTVRGARPRSALRRRPRRRQSHESVGGPRFAAARLSREFALTLLERLRARRHSDRPHVDRFRSLAAGGDLELDALTIGERAPWPVPSMLEK